MKLNNPRFLSLLVLFFTGASLQVNAQITTVSNNGTQIVPAPVAQGAKDWLMLKADLNVVGVSSPAILGMTCITSGNYAATDIVNLKVYYSESSTFNPGSSILLSALSSPGTPGTKTFPSFRTQYLPYSGSYGSNSYIYITADIDSGATLGNVISVNVLAAVAFTLSSGIITGASSPGGPQTISDGALANNSPQITSSNIAPGATDIVLHQSAISCGSTPRTLTGMTCTTAGNYTSSDITGLKVYYSSSNVFNVASSTLLSTLSSPGTGGLKTFASFIPQAIPVFSTAYIYITADVDVAATLNDRINVSALTTLDFTFSSGSVNSGSTTAGGNQTFAGATATFSDNGAQPGPGTAMQGATNVLLHQSEITFSNFTRWAGAFNVSTSGNYVAGDIASLNLYASSSSTFSIGSASLQSTINNPGAAGGKGFVLGINQTSSGVVYYYITANIAPQATAGNTISVDAFTASNIGVSIGAISGSAGAGGTQTIIANTVPSITLANNGFQVANSNIAQGAVNVLLHKSVITASNGFATITGMTCTTAGTYTASDITNLKVYFSDASTFDPGNSTLVSALSSPGAAGLKMFPSFVTQYILSGTSGYLYITADVAAGATVGNTVSVNALANTDFSIVAGSISGFTTGGGVQTITLTPSIILADNAPQVTAGCALQGTNYLVLHQSSLTVTKTGVTLTGMSCTVGGAASSQICGHLKVFYSTQSSFDFFASTMLSIISVGNGTQIFTSFIPQAIPSGTIAYIYITADVPGLVGGRSIFVNALTPADFTFSLGSATGVTSEGGLKSSCDVQLTDNAPQVVAATVPAGTTVVLHQSAIDIGPNTRTLTGMTCTTGGTFATADITNLKAWYQDSPAFTGSGTLLSTLMSPSAFGQKTFPSFTPQSLTSGTTAYIFITADISPTAAIGKTININALAPGNFSLSGATFYGSTINGGLQTITAPLFVIGNSPAEAPLSIYPNPAKNQFTVYGLQLKTEANLYIYNDLGEKVYSRQLETLNRKQETEIDISSFSPGIYFVLIQNANNKQFGKFIKE